MASKPTVYNLSWLTAPQGARQRSLPGPRHKAVTISAQKPFRAVILYPALATPAILVGDDDKLEILLLVAEDCSVDELRMHIRRQLKVSLGLDAAKSCTERALFIDADGKEVGTADDRKIDIEKIPFDAETLVSTLSDRFAGYVDHRAVELFKDSGYATLYRIAMSSKCLAAAGGSSELSACGEPHDELINKLLARRNKWAMQDGRCFCFSSSGGGDLDFTRTDASNPIQAYHPVYHYDRDALKYANFGHVSDVHLSARQQVLSKSRARVIDYVESTTGAADFDKSPEIGSRINVCSKDLIQILDKIGKSPADVLLVGGDLVDFLKNCLLSAAIENAVKEGNPAQVWQAVQLGEGFANNYKDCVDLISFYGILLDFCRSTSKPAYAVSGNHDCYWMPFGISPRIFESTVDHRANEGIPADHNLTFYEALLTFGETYGKLTGGMGSPFKPEMFDWFYTVVTPFNDYSVEFPRQHLVALAWGDEEDLFDTPLTGHGFGHLPRSAGVTPKELDLLEAAIGKKKNIILMTHFTFVSYADKIPVDPGDRKLGDVYCGDLKNFEDHNMGTFNQNRESVLLKHCGNSRDIQVILTGHSHRRALYLVDRVDTHGRTSLKTRHFDFIDFPSARSRHSGILKPAIIVSDSGGSIPRYNLDGEFSGWGSDPPSGTTVEFSDTDGSLSNVHVQRADCRPRVAVALDYMDIEEKKTICADFESIPFAIEDEKTRNLSRMVFKIELVQEMSQRGLAIESLTFYLRSDELGGWRKIELSPAEVHHSKGKKIQSFAIDGIDNVILFSRHFATHRSRGAFLAMKFAKLPGFARYNYDDSWCWEFQVDNVTSYGSISILPNYKAYRILRDKKRAEIPDFEWRRTNIPAKYSAN